MERGRIKDELEKEVKERTQDLQEVKERLDLAFRGAGDGPWDWDILTDKMVISKRMKELMGYDEHEIGNHFTEFSDRLHPDDLDDTLKAINAHLNQGSPYDVEYRLKTKSYGWRWFRARGQALWDSQGRPYRMAGSIQDIQDRKEKEGQLRLFESVIKNAHDLVVITEANNIEAPEGPKIVFVNDIFCSTTGYSSEEVVGETPRILQGEDTSRKELAIIKNSLMNKKNYQGELLNYTKQGNPYWVELNIMPIFDGKGETVYFAAVERNISDRKASEEKLKKYTNDLEFQQYALEQAKKDAEQANRLKSEFLATMSHEIRTPMNGVIGMTELLLETKLDTKQYSYASTVMNSAESLLQIINDILDFSKIEAEKLDLEPVPFSLRSCCEEVSDLLSIKCREKSVEIILHYPSDVQDCIIADPVRIRKIIMNFLSNAIKFTEKGSIEIKVEKLINLQIDDSQLEIKISVKDTGIGISKEAQKKIFEKFIQADSSTTRKFGGTGLGLAICKQLATMMGGAVGLSSQINEGSTFWFTMIVHKSDQPKIDNSYEKIPIDSLNILIVDDVDVNAEIIKGYLSPINATFSVAKGATQAMETIKYSKVPFDLLLIDYLMPNINGEELLRRLKQESLLQESCLPVLTSSAGTIKNSSFLIDAGFVGFVSKPIKRNSFLEVISRIWTMHQSGERNFFIAEDSLQSLTNNTNLKKKINIIVADDSRVNTEFAKEMLKKIGCDVVDVENGVSAIERLKSLQQTDIIFLDVNMPEMNGYEAAREITKLIEQGVIKNIPIVALTANDMAEDKKRCIDAGMSDFITKPMRVESIRAIIEKWIPDAFSYLEEDIEIPKENKILLVEDNLTNRDFMAELLKQFGCHFDVADNGLQAVNMSRKKTYDLILMDIQMPEMGGIEATKIIRADEKLSEKKVPIIALTTNALKEDKENCMDVGMSDYLSKPVKKIQVKEMLHKWLLDKAGREDTNNTIVNAEVFADYCGVVKGKKKAMLQTYRNVVINTLAGIDEDFIDENYLAISEKAHMIKSSSGQIGAITLSNTLGIVECLGQSNEDVNMLEETIRQANIEFKAVEAFLQNNL